MNQAVAKVMANNLAKLIQGDAGVSEELKKIISDLMGADTSTLTIQKGGSVNLSMLATDEVTCVSVVDASGRQRYLYML